MSKKLQTILLGLVVCFVIAFVIFGALVIRSAQVPESVTAVLQRGMALQDAEAMLMSRQFSKTGGQATDGDKYSFRKAVSVTDVETIFFIGDIDRRAIMVRIEHQDGMVMNVSAEWLRFEKAG